MYQCPFIYSAGKTCSSEKIMKRIPFKLVQSESEYLPYVASEVIKRFVMAIFLLALLISVGTIGYHNIMGWGPLDSLYMTVITVATVGFHEVGELSEIGRIFTIFLILSGLAIGGYAVGTIASFIIEGQLLNILKGSRMAREITNLKNHTIVCGYGKIGKEACERLAAAGEQFIVIDKDAEKIDEAIGHDYLAAIGDASDDDILLKVGVETAKSLISAISDDSANVYLVLTARTLNENLQIIARGTDEISQKKLRRVGANRVVSPYEIGARRMAAYVLKPEIVDFLEAFTPGGSYDLQLERIILSKSSSLVGKKLKDSNIRELTNGALVVGISNASGTMDVNPPGETVLEAGNLLLAIGNSSQLKALQKNAGK
jgi:voltage-gated potassium channel